MVSSPDPPRTHPVVKILPTGYACGGSENETTVMHHHQQRPEVDSSLFSVVLLVLRCRKDT